MRIYLEAIEIDNMDPEFIRSDVTGMSQTEQDAVKLAMQDILTGKTYRMSKHFCRHDEYGLCEMVTI